jgi:four helix bundle protein
VSNEKQKTANRKQTTGQRLGALQAMALRVRRQADHILTIFRVYYYIISMKGDDIAARFVALARVVVTIVDALPETLAARHVGGQLLRCGTSPGANYEEARGAESRRDFLHKLGVALKELQETRYWLRVVDEAKLAPDGDARRLLPEVEALCRILGASKRTASLRRDRASPQNGGLVDRKQGTRDRR